MALKGGSGLPHDFTEHPTPETDAMPHAQRRRTDRDAGERLAVLEHQVAAVDKQQREFREEMQIALHSLTEETHRGMVRLHERIDAFPRMISSAIAEHERQEEGLYGPRLLAIETGLLEMAKANNARQEMLAHLTGDVSDLKEMAVGLKGVGIAVLKYAFIGGGMALVAGISALVNYRTQIGHALDVLGF